MKVFLLLLLVSSVFSLKLLIIHSSNYNSDVANKLTPYFSVTSFDARSSTIDLNTALLYDVILLYTDFVLLDPITTGNVLASYVDHGKPVILATFAMTSTWNIEGRFVPNYLALNIGPRIYGTELDIIPILSNHPILLNVNHFDGGISSYHSQTSLTNQAILIAKWQDGYPLIATTEINGVRRVDLNFYPPSSDIRSDFWLSSTDGVQILVNSIRWVFNKVSCQFDWQCANSGAQYGFSTCQNGFCECRSNFFGDATPQNPCQCDTAQGDHLAYDQNGNPNCLNPKVCQVGTLIRPDLCSAYTENYVFVQCSGGECQCLNGFQGNATPLNKCRCDRTLTWTSNGPTCT